MVCPKSGQNCKTQCSVCYNHLLYCLLHIQKTDLIMFNTQMVQNWLFQNNIKVGLTLYLSPDTVQDEKHQVTGKEPYFAANQAKQQLTSLLSPLYTS